MTPERDAVSRAKMSVALAAAALDADADGALVDLRGYRCATLALLVGVGGITFTGTNKVEFVLKHGDASDGSDLDVVTDDDIINIDSVAPASVSTTGIIRTLSAAHAAATAQKIGYIGGKAYLRLTANFSGTHAAATPMAAVVELRNGEFDRVA